jgi:hypothetical protein
MKELQKQKNSKKGLEFFSYSAFSRFFKISYIYDVLS